MISEEEARAKIVETIRPLPSRQLPILRPGSGQALQALDCFAAENYVARLPLPNFDNSAMDGYAVIASDCRPGARLRLAGEQPAGVDRQLRVGSGQAIRIFTGAPMPAGADSVVMQEDVKREGDEIVVNEDVDPGQFIRRRGCDLSEGQKILAKGERIRMATLALLASQGLGEILVGGDVSASIVSTGDELAKPGEKLKPGQIYESNSIFLQALLQRCRAVAASVEHCGDDADSLGKVLAAAIKSQVVIISGGVSVGEHDLVEEVLRSLGARIDIWRVAIKPGKPFLFGRIKQSQPSPKSSPSGRGGCEAPGEGSISAQTDCLVFGLPGNPVSAFVTFLQFVRPAILKMMGASDLDLPKVPAKLSVDLSNESDRPHYIRGKLERGAFSPVGRQESHALFGLSRANALLRLAAGESRKRDTIVDVQIWD
jgi:molybdopterin molybdotransferase